MHTHPFAIRPNARYPKAHQQPKIETSVVQPMVGWPTSENIRMGAPHSYAPQLLVRRVHIIPATLCRARLALVARRLELHI